MSKRKYTVVESSIREICGFCGTRLIAYCVSLGGGQWACHNVVSGCAVVQSVAKPSLDEVFAWLSDVPGVTNVTASGLRANVKFPSNPQPATSNQQLTTNN